MTSPDDADVFFVELIVVSFFLEEEGEGEEGEGEEGEEGVADCCERLEDFGVLAASWDGGMEEWRDGWMDGWRDGKHMNEWREG